MRKTFTLIALHSSLVVLCFLLVISSQLLTHQITAQEITSEEKNQELKDQLITNIASRVAQLDLVEKRGIIGKVTDVANTQITVIDLQDNKRFIDVDELTRFSSPDAEESFGISDIEEDMTIGVLGLYNKESRRILARFVNEITTSLVIHGGVANVDDEEFTISVTTEDGDQVVVDIEVLTQTYSYTKDEGYQRSGFSKILVNFNIIVIGVQNITDENRMTATRIVVFPEIPVSPKVNEILEKSDNS
jgi:hypothetical protein